MEEPGSGREKGVKGAAARAPGARELLVGPRQERARSFRIARQTMATQSNFVPTKVSMLFAVWLDMSMPISAMTLEAAGLSLVGLTPALDTSYLSP